VPDGIPAQPSRVERRSIALPERREPVRDLVRDDREQQDGGDEQELLECLQLGWARAAGPL
jgi:hypothetical protein